MNSYVLMSPYSYTVQAPSIAQAVKNFIKMSDFVNVERMIISDQNKEYEARLKFFNENGKNKVGIKIMPYLPLTTGTPIVPMNPGFF